MLSNKLTFSLTLIVMLVAAFAFLTVPVMAQTAGDITPAADAGDFVVLSQAATALGITGVTATEVASMPADLEVFLRNGGTIELQASIDSTDNATMVAGYATSTDADEMAMSLRHHLVISEVMSGRDYTGTPPAITADSQWIEVYTNAAVDSSITLGGTPYRVVWYPTPRHTVSFDTVEQTDFGATDATDAIWVIVDRVSLINRFGNGWTNKSTSGNAVAEVAETNVPQKDVVSMYRTRDLTADASAYLGTASFGSGIEGGSWAASAYPANVTVGFLASPGSVHRTVPGGVQSFAKAAVTAADNGGMGVIINEIRDDTSASNVDWIELHNVNLTGDPISVNGWRLRLTTANDNDSVLAVIPDYKIAPGEFLLIVNRNPEETDLAGGIDLQDIIGKNEVNKGARHVYFVSANLNLPGSGAYLVTLRSGDLTSSHEQFVDFAGNGFFAATGTEMHPLRGWAPPGDRADFNVDTLASATMTIGRTTGLKSNGEYRSNSGGNRIHQDHWQTYTNQGSIGYDRDVDPLTSPGTPGYGNQGAVNLISDDRKNTSGTDDYAFGGDISISEVMYNAGPHWNLVQWIELYNSSLSEAIDLGGWKMEIQNKEDVQSYVDASFLFNAGTVIQPNQTLLIVSRSGANDVASSRVYDLFRHHRDDLGLPAGRVARLLSRTGFNIKLYAKLDDRMGDVRFREPMEVVDEAGNLMVSVDNAERTVMWELPTSADPNVRQSIVRQYGERMRDGDGRPDPANDGTMEDSWNLSDLAGAGISYYGHGDDIGTPGFRLGGPLPVELASFRPLRDKATGAVTIRWATESELNNAGFNILRSESKTGAFQVVNVKGIIPGHGTTSEKHTYEWTDTTAKPNVVYYYQIEDVSFDGNRTTLATTHLRGNVTAAGKVTTTWGDLKTQN